MIHFQKSDPSCPSIAFINIYHSACGGWPGSKFQSHWSSLVCPCPCVGLPRWQPWKLESRAKDKANTHWTQYLIFRTGAQTLTQGPTYAFCNIYKNAILCDQHLPSKKNWAAFRPSKTRASGPVLYPDNGSRVAKECNRWSYGSMNVRLLRSPKIKRFPGSPIPKTLPPSVEMIPVVNDFFVRVSMPQGSRFQLLTHVTESFRFPISTQLLVGGFIPVQKYQSIGMSIPNMWKNKSHLPVTTNQAIG